ncbi:MAG: glycosyltransferase family 39 protein [Chloroflexi bacterium]|nr:glycosyltransferase family 39 protein [Chloroflexota bacterium]
MTSTSERVLGRQLQRGVMGGVHWKALVLPAAVFSLALGLRLFGLDWDSGGLFHPDERFILMTVEGRLGLPWPPALDLLLDLERSPLNPRFFAYGSLPLYLLKLVAHLASALDPALARSDLRLVARALSAFADATSVLLTYLIGRKLGGNAVALIAALLVTFAAIHLQLAHFFAVDTLLVCWLLLVLWLALRLIEQPQPGRAIALGVAFGLALATKVSVAPLGLAVAGAHLLARPGTASPRVSATERILGGMLLSFLGAGLVFVVTQPFVLLDWPTFVANVTEQSEMVRRIRDYPYTRQYIDTPKYWYHLSQLALFGLGLPFGIVGWLGFAYALLRVVIWRYRQELLLLLWAGPYFLITGAFEVKFLRYLLPLTPLLALFAARLLVDLTALLGRLGPRGRVLGQAVSALVVGATALWGLAYLQVYTRPHPAVAMARWITANVPPGSTIAREHWEEGLPGLGQYRFRELPLYDPDDLGKLRTLATTLASADYLVFYSQRLYGTIPRLPERYPLSTEYYRRLFAGELGYRLVHAEASYPTLFGVALADNPFVRPGLPIPAGLERFLPSPRIDLGFADESYSVYDHPLVLLFKRTEPLTSAQIEDQLAPFLTAGNASGAAPRRGSGLLLPPEVAAADWAGGTWREIFPATSLPNALPVVCWLLAAEGIALLSVPVAFLVGRRLPDRGWFLAKPLGVLLVAWLVFLGASLRVVPFERWSIALAVLLLAGASALVLRWQGRTLWADLRARQRTLLVGQLLFWLAFLAFVWVRSLNPDLWHPARGGEKPMDLAYLTAVVRATYFPPYDPWFAGGVLNYYYFGQVVVATLIKLTGIVPEVSYNLAVALWFAFTVVLAFSVLFNLARWRREHAPGEGAAWGAGVAAALFVAVVGNLDGLAQLLDGLRAAGTVVVATQLPLIGGAVQAGSGFLRVLSGEAQLPAFDFWRSSRMMPPQISITEFPYFTFLFADLHAHLIALPFTLLVVALAVNAAFGGRRLPTLLALALATGALRPMNTWDYPTYLLLAVGALAIGGLGRPLPGWLWGTAWRTGVVVGLGYLAFLPYYQHYELFYSGIELARETTPLHQYLAVHGFFLFLAGSWLAYEVACQLQRAKLTRLLDLAGRYWDRLPRLLGIVERRSGTPLTARALGVVGVALLLLLLAVLGLPTPAFVLALLLPAGLLALQRLQQRDGDRPRDLLVLTLFGLGLALGAAVDLVTLQGDIARMNTVFKLYLQAWVLLALTAAYACWRLVLAGPVLAPTTSRDGWRGRFAWTTVASLLLASTLIYPVAATPARVRDRFGPLPPTIDGMAFLTQAVYQDERGPIELRQDYAAVRWLRENLDGTPVIVEGVTPFYRWGARISIYTGLPTVIGWDWHQKQQRWGYQEQVDRRIAEVNAFYSGSDPAAAAAFLRKYGVRYVIVGTVERNYYPAAGLAKFEQMGDLLQPVYRAGSTTIYRVVA